jgi:two-component system sensor histidine kinase DctS
MPALTPPSPNLALALVLPRLPRQAAWAWPLLLALAFTAAAAGWLQWSDARGAEDERATLIADALTLDSRIAAWLADEQARVNALAETLPAVVDDAKLLGNGALAAGLQRQWVSVTALDAGNRLMAHVPPQTPRAETGPASGGLDVGGLTAHLSAPLQGGGRLVVRFAPASLLRQSVPWWLSRKYDVRLIDGLGQLIAGRADPRAAAADGARETHRLTVEPALADTWLELAQRESRVPWWRTPPLLLMAVFLALSALSTWALRRRMLEVGRAEAMWRTEAAWRRAIEDALTVGLRGRDLEGRLVHVNRAFCDLVGHAPDALLGRLPPMPYWPPDAIEGSMSRLRRNMAGGAPREGYEARWVRADGAAIDVMIFEAPLVDAQGRHIGWMGSIVDITARKRADERERRQIETLATQARLTTLGEVASALAHQLNQPLTAITGYNAGVLRALERSGSADPVLIDAVRRLGEQAAEAGRIVQRIRGFLSRRAPQRERCEVAAIVQRALELLRRDLLRQGVEVETVIAADLPAVRADPVLVEQVLINLVRNAADALAPPGVAPARICISAAPAGLPAAAASARFVRIDVEDNGPGLQGLAIEQLAAPFYSTKAEGMGMGLAICRSVVEAHHGALEALASPLGGARLAFTLPVADEEEAAE